MPADIVHETTLPFAPELVWQVLTTPDALGRWLMQTTFEGPKPGHTFRFQDRPRPFWDGVCDCEVAEAEPAKKLVLKWNVQSPPASTVSWTLTPAANGGTHVAFRHAGLSGLSGFFMKAGMTKGWLHMLTRSWPFMLERLAKGQPLPSRDEVKAVQRGQAKA